MPRTEDAPDAMLTIAPFLRLSIAGRKALIVRCIDLTLRSKEKSQSCSEQSSTEPWWTKPAQFTSTSTGPTLRPMSLASASTASVERTSSFSRTAPRSPLSLPVSRSVATTLAPSAKNASAMARPIPCPAAVTSAIFPFSRPAISASQPSIELLYHMDQSALAQDLDFLASKAVALVPGDVAGQFFAGVEPHLAPAQLARPRFGNGQQPIADASSLQLGSYGHAPDQKVLGSCLEDQHAFEPIALLRQPYVVIGNDRGVVDRERQWLEAENGPVARVRGMLEHIDGGNVGGAGAPQLRCGARRPPVHGRLRPRSWRKKPLSSANGTASARASKVPASAMARAARMKPPQAARASAPPTLMRRTPISARSFTVKPSAPPISTLTGFGATASTIFAICSRVRRPGA